MHEFSRRKFIQMGLCVAVTAAVPGLAFADKTDRKLAFYNIHTGESLKVTYRENGQYVSSALQELRHFLRDYRTGDIHTMDTALFEQLYRLQQLMETQGEFHVISGYRSPKTNHMLHEHSNGVANHSLHMEGKAIDICLPGKDLSYLHQAALSMRAGGVGYYPSTGFVHIDTGRVRHWG
ncbi:MAG TPA: YcbK family protein [Rickettsiales bacterium]|nr:YcbK family protein [Rickettsiales bacterium]